MSYFKYGGRSVYYEEYGEGSPVIFLHGNTASSKMFEPLLPLYAGKCRCILIDFLGNGRSDRVEKFPADLWYDEAMQTVALARHLGYGKVSLVGVALTDAHSMIDLPKIFWQKGHRRKPIYSQGSFMSGVREKTGKKSLTLILLLC